MVEIDEGTMKFCESLPKQFPLFDSFGIFARLVPKAVSSAIDLRRCLDGYDPTQQLWMSRDAFIAALGSCGLSSYLSDQELLSVTRRFQGDGDQLHYREASDLLSHEYLLQTEGEQRASGSMDNLRAFLNNVRGRSTQWRRAFRLDPEAAEGKIHCSRAMRLFKKFGVSPPQKIRGMVEQRYMAEDEAAEVAIQDKKRAQLPKEEPRIDARELVGTAAPLKQSSSRALRRESPASSQRPSIALQRQALSQTSLLRPDTLLSTDGSPRSGNAAADPLIDYHKLCDDIYVSDWL